MCSSLEAKQSDFNKIRGVRGELDSADKSSLSVICVCLYTSFKCVCVWVSGVVVGRAVFVSSLCMSEAQIPLLTYGLMVEMR